nr:hypothetical protein [Candidatus Mycoplasma haematolamae]
MIILPVKVAAGLAVGGSLVGASSLGIYELAGGGIQWPIKKEKSTAFTKLHTKVLNTSFPA